MRPSLCVSEETQLKIDWAVADFSANHQEPLPLSWWTTYYIIPDWSCFPEPFINRRYTCKCIIDWSCFRHGAPRGRLSGAHSCTVGARMHMPSTYARFGTLGAQCAASFPSLYEVLCPHGAAGLYASHVTTCRPPFVSLGNHWPWVHADRRVLVCGGASRRNDVVVTA